MLSVHFIFFRLVAKHFAGRTLSQPGDWPAPGQSLGEPSLAPRLHSPHPRHSSSRAVWNHRARRRSRCGQNHCGNEEVK